LKRNVFLDNEDQSSYIERQIWQLADQARQEGHAIGIGHYRKKTLDAIKKLAPKIRKQGIQIVALKDLLAS
ncbi:MAG: divergent polysaccharide deacetylase family protein, partial [Candidatus Omnitrophica bacterium]|nr:divergent polysaccharide deacetylase family protein [Candidatus Omnitrophota bacterium]